MENINTTLLDFKRLDNLLRTTKNSNLSSYESDFSSCLKDAKSKVLKDERKTCLGKDLKLVKTDEKSSITKAKSTKANNILVAEVDEDKFEELGEINEEIQEIIVNLIVFFQNDETVNIEEIEKDCIQLLQELEPIILAIEDEYKNNVNIELNEEDVELLKTVVDNLNEVNDLLLDTKNNKENKSNNELVTKIERQVIEFEQQLKPIINKMATREVKNEIILNVNNQEVQEVFDNKSVLINDEVTVTEANEITAIKGEEKTEVPEEKLEDNDFNMEESFKEPLIVNSSDKQIFNEKVNKILNKEVEIPKEEVLKQIIDKGKAVITNDKSEVKIKLKPEILGELVLKIELEKGVVVAKALVDNYRVKELLETNMYQLKEGLEEQGVKIKTFEVQVGSNTDFEKQNRQSAFNNGKRKKIKIKQLDLEDMNVYEENTVSYSPSIGNESTLDLLA